VPWAKKEAEKMESALKNITATYETERNRLRIETGAVRAMLKNITALEKYFKPDMLNTLIDFVSGDIGYVVVQNYGTVEIKTFLDVMKYVDYGCCESLRMLTLYGKSDGNLEWGINQYSDGSGYSNGRPYPCKTHDDALKTAQEMLEQIISDRGMSSDIIKNAEKYGLHISEEKMCEFRAAELKRKKKDVDEATERLRQAKIILANAKK